MYNEGSMSRNQVPVFVSYIHIPGGLHVNVCADMSARGESCVLQWCTQHKVSLS